MKIAVPRASRSTSRESQLQSQASRSAAPHRRVERARGPALSLPEAVVDVLQSRHSSSDRFDSNSLLAQVWLVQLRKYTEVRVAGPAHATKQALQSGQAWRSFARMFYPLSPIDSVRLFENLLRFSNFAGFPPARTLFLAYAPLAFEHDVSGEYIGPGVWTPEAGSSKAALRVRRTLRRWCDWLEAIVHLQVHQKNHATSNHLDLDAVIIALWPLLTRHAWSYVDLLGIIRGSVPSDSPGNRAFEEQFGAYCNQTLGLHASATTSAARGGILPGQDAAERLVKFLPALQ